VEEKETVAVIRNQFQISKLERQINSKTQMSKILYILNFGIHLAFACRREAASAKAGILKFDIFVNPSQTYTSSQ
jgi:hypothetical protein